MEIWKRRNERAKSEKIYIIFIIIIIIIFNEQQTKFILSFILLKFVIN